MLTVSANSDPVTSLSLHQAAILHMILSHMSLSPVSLMMEFSIIHFRCGTNQSLAFIDHVTVQ